MDESVHRLSVEETSEQSNVRLVLRAIDGELVAQEVEWIGDEHPRVAELELARRTGFDVSGGQPLGLEPIRYRSKLSIRSPLDQRSKTPVSRR